MLCSFMLPLLLMMAMKQGREREEKKKELRVGECLCLCFSLFQVEYTWRRNPCMEAKLKKKEGESGKERERR